MRILVVEDEKSLNRIIAEAIEDEGYSVDSCFDGADALEHIMNVQYDVMVLDIMLPKLDGIQLVKRVRSAGNTTPVLYLTAKDSVEDKVMGLEAGGDYYLVKPFDFRELIAVLRVMARKNSGNTTNVYQIADLTLDSTAKTVTRAGKTIDLTGKEFSLMEYMIRNKGIVLSRDMIENNVWSFDHDGGTNVVDVYVGYLRKKLDTGFDKKLIHTVWGSGWILRED